jgi:hypothetical protein
MITHPISPSIPQNKRKNENNTDIFLSFYCQKTLNQQNIAMSFGIKPATRKDRHDIANLRHGC